MKRKIYNIINSQLQCINIVSKLLNCNSII